MAGHVLIFFVCLIALGIASAGQSAFAYLNATRFRSLMQHGATRSQAVQQIAHEPGPMLASISLLYLAAIAIATVVAVDFARWQFADPVPQYASLAVAALLLLGTQQVARAIAMIKPERAAMLLYRPLSVFGLLSRPITAPWHLLTNALLRRLFGVEEHVATTEEDMRALVDVVEETAALEEDEREMITSIFELSDRDVREIMVPRVDIVALPTSMAVNEAVDVLVSSGHSRVPVYEGDLDHVAGMVHLRDLAQALRAGRGGASVSQFLRAVHVVPETKKIDELLREFQSQRIQMAVVADEYGGTAGVVTIEDMLEEIVGEIRDEYDVEEEEPIQRLSRTEALMDARVSIHDAAEVLPIEVGDGDFDTIGGLVYQRLDKVPAVGDVVQLEHCTIKVVATKGRRVQRVLVTIAPRGETAEASAEHP
jgi:CBS domain containing-hemolysin-like protein